MLKPIRWQTLPKDFFVIQLGFALFGLALAMLVRANIGVNPWTMLSVALADHFNSTPGRLTILIGIGILVFAVLLGEQVGWGTLGNILFIGPWFDFFLGIMPSLTEQWVLQLMLLLSGILLLGLATGLYISVNAGAGPRDTLMLGLSRLTSRSIRLTRSGIELVVFVIAFLLGGPAGVGTIIIALLIGPAVQLGFKLCGVESK